MDNLSWAFCLYLPVRSNLLVSIFLITAAWHLCKMSFLRPHRFLQTQTVTKSSPPSPYILHFVVQSSIIVLPIPSIDTNTCSINSSVYFFLFFSCLIYLMWRHLFSIRPRAGLNLRTNPSRHILQGDEL